MKIKPTFNKATLRVFALAITAVMCTLVILSAVFPFPEGTYDFLSIGMRQRTAYAQGSGNWTINGSSVYWEDDKVYLSATPHTLNSSGWIEFELESKVWSGEIDVVWGFPADIAIKPKNPQRWALNVSHELQRQVIVERRYTLNVCNISTWTKLTWNGIEPDIGNHNNTSIYNVTAADWQCTGTSGNYTSYIIAFNSYTGNKQHAIFYGNRDTTEMQTYYEYYDDWVSWNPPPMQTANYTYAGVDQWNVVKLDQSIQVGKRYKVRAWIDVPIQLGAWSCKYVWAVKPSTETIQQAKDNGHLYLLDPWLSGGWNYRKPITVTNANADYQTKVLVGQSSGATGYDVHCGGHVAADFDDLRFTAADGTTLLDYWIESITGTTPNCLATVWVQNNAAANTTLYMYYGGTETAVSNGDNTFLFFDDFADNSLNTTKWDFSGTITESGTEVALLTSGAYIRSKSTSTFGLGTALRVRSKTSTTALSSYLAMYAATDYSKSCLAEVTLGLAKFFLDSKNTLQTQILSDIPKDTSYHKWEVRRVSTTGLYLYIDDVLKASQTNAAYIPTDSLIVWLQSGADGAKTVTGDWFLVRKVAATEPSFAFGSEETLTPEITNTPGNYGFGVISVNTASNTAINYFTLSNTGNCAVDVVIYGTDLTGGNDTWDLSDTATPGENIYGLYVGLDDVGDLFDIIVKEYGSTPYNYLIENLAESATQGWGMKLYMPTSVSGYDAQQMSGTITLVASASS